MNFVRLSSGTRPLYFTMSETFARNIKTKPDKITPTLNMSARRLQLAIFKKGKVFTF